MVVDQVIPQTVGVIGMGHCRFRQAAAQPTIVGSLMESVIYPSNARRDFATWTNTSEAFTAPWNLSINCIGVPAGGVLYWAVSLYRLRGQ